MFQPDRKPSLFARVQRAVEEIPRGKVASYGQVARLAGQPRAARSVAWALRAAPEKRGIPWHRVVNSQRKISLGGRYGDLQRALLESEGVTFGKNGRIPMRYLWQERAD